MPRRERGAPATANIIIQVPPVTGDGHSGALLRGMAGRPSLLKTYGQAVDKPALGFVWSCGKLLYQRPRQNLQKEASL
jgi:hypothetical protein